jgi:hypothetical protein
MRGLPKKKKLNDHFLYAENAFPKDLVTRQSAQKSFKLPQARSLWRNAGKMYSERAMPIRYIFSGGRRPAL